MSAQWIVALSGALPALLLMWYVDRLDARRPEPRATLRRTALLGGLTALPVVLVSIPLLLLAGWAQPSPVVSALFHAFLVAALVEESGKVACVRLFVWHRPEFDERMDGIVYATRAGLGFALVENVLFLLSPMDVGGFLQVFVLRAVLAIPLHAIAAGFMGYFAARRRFDGVGPGLLGGLGWAVLLHGTYDAALLLSVPLAASGADRIWVYALLSVPALIVIFGGLALRWLASRALELDDMATALRGRPDASVRDLE